MTPNSFSDPNFFLENANLESVIKNYLENFPDLIFDFGFESTAPMNQGIDLELERARFDQAFEILSQFNFNGRCVSFDTYKIENYKYFESRFKDKFQDMTFIFNDVSGCLDSELNEFLKTKKDSKDFYYICCFTFVPSREKVLDHMLYANDCINIQKCFIDFLESARNFFINLGLDRKVIYDPAFGFSKTYEQNWELISNFKNFAPLSDQWCIGLSKKSFLRKYLSQFNINALTKKEEFEDSERLHILLLNYFGSLMPSETLYRLHDPKLLSILKAYSDLPLMKNL